MFKSLNHPFKCSLFSLFLILGFSSFFSTSHANPIFSQSQHSAYFNMGFTEGGFGMGADYEYGISDSHGIGGYTRFYKKDDDAPVTSHGYFTFGFFVRPHFQKKSWDFYVSPGIGVINIDSTTGDDETTLGPSLALGLMYQLQSQISLGVENMKHYVWFSDDYRGLVVDDFMLKLRVRF